MSHAISDKLARTNRRKCGILCPHCAEPLRVSHTRLRSNGVIHRFRDCGTCSYRMRTVERPDPHPHPQMRGVR